MANTNDNRASEAGTGRPPPHPPAEPSSATHTPPLPRVSTLYSSLVSVSRKLSAPSFALPRVLSDFHPQPQPSTYIHSSLSKIPTQYVRSFPKLDIYIYTIYTIIYTIYNRSTIHHSVKKTTCERFSQTSSLATGPRFVVPSTDTHDVLIGYIPFLKNLILTNVI